MSLPLELGEHDLTVDGSLEVFQVLVEQTQAGRVLPPAIIAMLIVYCLRGVSFAAPGGWVPQLVSVATVVILHLWRSNTLLSIFGGTILYMVLVQAVFP